MVEVEWRSPSCKIRVWSPFSSGSNDLMDNLRLDKTLRWKVETVGWESWGVWYGKSALQGCSPRLCQLRTDGLAPVSKFWTYRLHAGVYGPIKPMQLVVNWCFDFHYYFNGCLGRETRWRTQGSLSRAGGCVGSPFSRESYVDCP
jgi:hypothetical protein